MTIRIKFADGTVHARDWIERGGDEAQALLRRNKETYPLCLCTRAGVPMCIRAMRSTGKHYLARMPGTGPSHAVSCPSYEVIHGKAEADAIEDGSIVMLPDGRVMFKLDVGFGIRDNAAVPGVRPDPSVLPQAVQQPPARLGLFALLQVMWEQAELHHWHPKMAGKRHYGLVYRLLMDVAEHLIVKGFPLSYRLFMPEPFHRKRAEEIHLKRLERLSHLSRGSHGERRRFLVLGQIRRAKGNTDAVRLWLSHLGDDLKIQVATSMWERICKRWDVKLDQETQEGVHVWGLFLIDEIQGGIMLSRAGAILQTTTHFIPTFRLPEVGLAYGLVDSGRRFIKRLVLDGRPVQSEPAFVLTDTAEPFPLYIVEQGIPDAGSSEAEWYWHTDRQAMWPPLPMPRRAVEARRVRVNQ